MASRLEFAASTFWDNFYKSNRDRFFKDRHYLHREFPLLSTPEITVLEVRSPDAAAATWC